MHFMMFPRILPFLREPASSCRACRRQMQPWSHWQWVSCSLQVWFVYYRVTMREWAYTYEYLIQMTPVAKIAICWYGDTFSAGLSRSFRFEKVIAHLKVGAQKKTENYWVREKDLPTCERTSRVAHEVKGWLGQGQLHGLCLEFRYDIHK